MQIPWRAFSKLFLQGEQSQGPFSLKGFYEDHFDVLHRAAWAAIFYQLIRILALNRITPRFYQACVSRALTAPESPLQGKVSSKDRDGGSEGNLSARSARSAAPSLAQSVGDVSVANSDGGGGRGGKGSKSSDDKAYVTAGANAFSTAEILLLKWLALHHNCVRTESTVFLSNFTTDLWDSRALASAIISHVPTKKQTLDRIKEVSPTAADEDAENHRISNAKILLSVMQDLQFPFLPPPEAIAAGNSRVMVLLVLSMMDMCPQLVPRATIDFKGRLNADVVRQVQLDNPVSRSVTYLVRLEGSDEFRCDDKYVVLKPKTSSPVSVIHKGKFSLPSSCTLFLLASDAQERVSPLVFNLSATVVSNQPSAMVVEHTGRLYEMSTIEVPVVYPFDTDMCNFHITLSEREPAVDKKGGLRPQGGGAGGITNWKALPSKAFWIKKDRLKVSRKGHGVVYVHFLPTRVSNQICSLNFKDENHGEFTIDIAAQVQVPASSENIKFSQADRRLVIKDIQLSPKNLGLDKARLHLTEMLGKDGATRFFKELSEAPPATYKVQYLNPNMRGPSEVVLGPQGAGKPKKAAADDSKGGGKAEASNRLSLQVECKGPGQYQGEIVLRSKLDVRVVTVVCSLLPREVNVDLSFACPIRQSISQEIPVTNKSSQEWTVQSQVTSRVQLSMGIWREWLINFPLLPCADRHRRKGRRGQPGRPRDAHKGLRRAVRLQGARGGEQGLQPHLQPDYHRHGHGHAGAAQHHHQRRLHLQADRRRRGARGRGPLPDRVQRAQGHSLPHPRRQLRWHRPQQQRRQVLLLLRQDRPPVFSLSLSLSHTHTHTHTHTLTHSLNYTGRDPAQVHHGPHCLRRAFQGDS